MNIEESKNVLNYLLDNNLQLAEQGLDKIAINLIGEAGIGKTALVKQLAEERGAKYTRLELASLEEIGDIVGVPIKTYIMYSPTGEEVKVVEKLLPQYLNLGYNLCPNCDPIMSYAKPEWVPDDEEQEAILLLDDFTRASSLFMQAIMGLVQFGEYVSWKLPKKCHLMLSSNPDTTDYMVTALDEAQQSRLLNFNIEFDVKIWSRWADMANLPNTLINFALLTPEIFDKGRNINARSYTIFANALRGITNYQSAKSLELISLISKGCFGDDELISTMLTTFIHNHLDEIISPEDLIKGNWIETKAKLQSNIIRNGTYRADIASIITIRLLNYIDNFFSVKNNSTNKSETVIKRLEEIITDPQILLTEDLIYKTVKSLCSKYPTRMNNLLMNPQVRSKLL